MSKKISKALAAYIEKAAKEWAMGEVFLETKGSDDAKLYDEIVRRVGEGGYIELVEMKTAGELTPALRYSGVDAPELYDALVDTQEQYAGLLLKYEGERP